MPFFCNKINMRIWVWIINKLHSMHTCTQIGYDLLQYYLLSSYYLLIRLCSQKTQQQSQGIVNYQYLNSASRFPSKYRYGDIPLIYYVYINFEFLVGFSFKVQTQKVVLGNLAFMCSVQIKWNWDLCSIFVCYLKRFLPLTILPWKEAFIFL